MTFVPGHIRVARVSSGWAPAERNHRIPRLSLQSVPRGEADQ
jgi:hypothetical protein